MTATPTLRERLTAGEAGPHVDALFHVAMHGKPEPQRDKYADEDSYLWAMAAWKAERTAFVKPISTSLDALRAATPEGWRLESVVRRWVLNIEETEVILVRVGDEGRVCKVAATICGAWALAIMSAMGKGGER